MHATWFLFLLVSQAFQPLPAAAALLSLWTGARRSWWPWVGVGVLSLVHVGLAFAWNDLATCLHGPLWVTTGAGAVGVFLGVRLAVPLGVSCVRAPTWRCAAGLGVLGCAYALFAAFSWLSHMMSVDCGI